MFNINKEIILHLFNLEVLERPIKGATLSVVHNDEDDDLV